MTKRRSPYALEPQHAASPTRRPKRSQEALLAPSPAAPGRNQPGTPLVLSDAERDVMDAVDAKLAALAGAQKAAPPSRTEKQDPETPQMSVEALEQKKMLLPYLDKIEYINYQLRARGLLPPSGGCKPALPESSEAPDTGAKPKMPAKPPARGGAAALVTPNQEESAAQAAESLLPRSPAGLSTATLRARYPRLLEPIAGVATLAPRVRPVTWLLKLVDDVYDSLAAAMLPAGESQDAAAQETAASASPGPESVAAADTPATRDERRRRRRGRAPPGSDRFALPLFARRFVQHSLGLPALAAQDCVDLALNLELRREQLPQAALFSSFLRELVDGDALLFFLVARDAAQRELRLQLGAKEKLARTSSAKLYVRGDLFSLAPHPRIPDGTKQVLLASPGCECVLRSVFASALAARRAAAAAAVPAPSVLAQFVTQEALAALVGGGRAAPIEDVLARLVELFRAVSEDIVAQFKYNDDGESLTNLLRLRDTIASDAKVAALVARLGEQERELRRLRLELLRLERATGDGRCRTQICLLQSRVALLESDRAHVQREVGAAEARVDGVWSEVVRPTRAAPSRSPLEAALASVLGRFECFVARLQRTHELEAKASALLARPWKQQVLELEQRTVVRLQRAYRARRAAREAKAQARDQVREQLRERELQRQQEQLERKRVQARREKDAQRHHARLRAKQDEEQRARAQLASRERALLATMRAEQVAQRTEKRGRELRAHAFATWQRFVARRRQTRRAHALFAKLTFLRWKLRVAAAKRRERAARRLQRWLRARRQRALFRRALNLRVKRTRVARKCFAKAQHRRLNALFQHWSRFAAHAQTLRANLQAALATRTSAWLQRWVAFVACWKATTIEAAVRIQRVYRGRVARQVLRCQRRRRESALLLQRVFRGHAARGAVRRLRQLRSVQSAGSAALVHRIQSREVRRCFGCFQLHVRRARAVKRLALRRRASDQLRGFSSWAAFVARRRAKRAARLRRQRECAVLIQRNFRRHRCQVRFADALRRRRAAVAIQRVARGAQGRERARTRRRERCAATQVQSAWRRRRAEKLAAALRTERILLGAFKGDYSATKRALAAGYGCVLDAEGNGILHMAAAAGHKRLVKLCLRHALDANAPNRRLQTPLHLLLANLPPEPLDDSGAQRQERTEKVALAAYMIDHGAWHEAPDEDGFTPLLLCAVLGHADALEALLEREANTDARTLSGSLNAAQLAAEGNHWRALQALLASRGFDFEPHARDTVRLLHACAGRGFLDCLRVLVAHIRERFDTFPADVLDTPDDDGYTPLIYAISNGFVDVVRCLLESDAAPDAGDFFGRSPLHFAVALDDAACSEAVVALLTTYEADVNVKDRDGDAPLHRSCDRDARLACTSLLLAHGAMICANALGNHPTHIAARYGAVGTLQLLEQYGGDMNLKNYEGRTPLGMARMHGQQLVVQHIAHAFANEPVSGGGVEDIDQHPPPEVDKSAGFDDDISDDQLRVQHPLGTSTDDWQHALARGYCMGAIAEWTQYVDTATDTPFYATGKQDHAEFSWEPSAEFEAAMGEDWEVVRATSSDDVVQYVYHHKLTGEARTSVPPVDYALLQDVVQNSKRQKLLRARVRKLTSANDASASATEYVRFVRTFEAESAQARAEIRAAIAIQRHFRARRTRRLIRALLHENRSALEMQRAFRGRKARQLAETKRHEHASATRIQAAWRGFAVRKLEAQGGRRAQRLTHARRRDAALFIQRVFRGWRGRRAWFREKVVCSLGPKGYFAWEQLRRRAVVVRSFKVWDELVAPRDFPGVRFYCHRVTRSCSWSQPSEWVAQDRVDVDERSQLFRWGYTQPMRLAALRLQKLWRARTARVAFQAILRAVRLMRSCEQEYLEDPTNLVNMGNYVLYLHAVAHDYERARPLYGRLMRAMAQRGPDVAFVLLSYGIFLHVTQEEDAALVEEMIVRGKAADPQLRRYKMAFLGFFRQAVVQHPHDAESNLNYAACAQWLYEQYDEAARFYVRAIAADPHKKGYMELFQEMLDRKRQVDKLKRVHQPKPGQVDVDDVQYDGFEIFRRWQAQQAAEEDRVRRQALQAENEAREREAAARKLQARYRRRLAMRTTNRLQLERRMGESIAALAKQKAVYDRVAAAFERAAQKPSAKSSAKSPPLSLPVTQLRALLRALNASLSDAHVQQLTAAFRESHPRLQHVNVMDVCAFVEANGVLE